MIDYIFDNAVGVLEVIVTVFCVIMLITAILGAVVLTLVVVEDVRYMRKKRGGKK